MKKDGLSFTGQSQSQLQLCLQWGWVVSARITCLQVKRLAHPSSLWKCWGKKWNGRWHYHVTSGSWKQQSTFFFTQYRLATLDLNDFVRQKILKLEEFLQYKEHKAVGNQLATFRPTKDMVWWWPTTGVLPQRLCVAENLKTWGVPAVQGA